jgi:glycosyltransferase involved in cell wall biosynthesis
MMDVISVVVPCYNEEQAVPLFMSAIAAIADKMSGRAEFEFIFVDDGSCDSTLDVLRRLSEKDSRVKYISFSRNFGKEAAMFAGLEHAGGDYVAVMDADLQHPPELIEEMYAIINTREYDCVAAKRAPGGGEPRMRLFFSRAFYRLINSISKVKFTQGALDYRLITRQVVNSILQMKERSRFLKGIYSWVGFRTKWIECESQERKAGKSAWSLGKLICYSLDGIASFSSAPLYLSFALGALFCLLAFGLLVAAVIEAACYGSLPRITSVLCAGFFVGGAQLICTGILGLYIYKTHLEVKRRPIYIVKETSLR